MKGGSEHENQRNIAHVINKGIMIYQQVYQTKKSKASLDNFTQDI